MLLKAVALGTALGVAMKIVGFVPSFRSGIFLNLAFAVCLWWGFELFGPWLVVDRAGANPGRAALVAILKMVFVFTFLLALAVFLVRVLTGLNILAFWFVALPTFLVGLLITVVINAFLVTSSLVTSEKERADAAVAHAVVHAENERKSKELEEARALQVSMLPGDAPSRDGLDVAFGMRTATEVGGDYYDWKVAEDGTLFLALGDATGHGVRAGLVVVAAKTLFQTAEAASGPAEQLRRASEGVKSLNLKRMNMALTLLTVRGGDVRIGLAGMPPALHYRAAETDVVEVTIPAPAAGQMRAFAYTDTSLRLEAGDRLLLATDGLAECLDPRDDVLGYARVSELFRAVATQPAAAIVAALFAEAETWAAGRPFDDDISIIVLARA